MSITVADSGSDLFFKFPPQLFISVYFVDEPFGGQFGGFFRSEIENISSPTYPILEGYVA